LPGHAHHPDALSSRQLRHSEGRLSVQALLVESTLSDDHKLSACDRLAYIEFIEHEVDPGFDRRAERRDGGEGRAASGARPWHAGGLSPRRRREVFCQPSEPTFESGDVRCAGPLLTQFRDLVAE
jgi:hypothetical protein